MVIKKFATFRNGIISTIQTFVVFFFNFSSEILSQISSCYWHYRTNKWSPEGIFLSNQTHAEKNSKNTDRCGGKNPHNKLSIFVIFYASKYFTNINAAIFNAIDVTVSSLRFLSLPSKQTQKKSEREK